MGDRFDSRRKVSASIAAIRPRFQGRQRLRTTLYELVAVIQDVADSDDQVIDVVSELLSRRCVHGVS